ncbi:hypothetical protein [Bacillus toyonensis]|uniref:hypothetical protein n=1 Tax=Bacillus toyonensis TaxID=155322 RepID=UPI000BF7447D|nr:hypothetical protein [Bacillus toyonensis]PGF05215.1 hypothetical protein COM61_01995 [Bacillus toyonensis]
MNSNTNKPNKQSIESEQTGFFIKMNDIEPMRVKTVTEMVLENHNGSGQSLTGFYPVRKHVRVDQSKVELQMSEFRSEYRTKDIDMYTELRKQIRKHYNDSYYDSEMSFKEFEEYYFKENDGKLPFENEDIKDHVVTKEAYDTFFIKQKLNKQAMEFEMLQEYLDAFNYLPVNKLTKSFIDFKEGVSLLSIRLEASEYQSQTISAKIIANLQTGSSHSWNNFEVVNIEKTSNSFYLNLLCTREEEGNVLDYLGYALKKSGVYKTFKWFLYNFDVEIERNLNKENYSKDWYHFFKGNKAGRLKDIFVKQEQQFLDHDLYM